jgi:hypothetical protein
MLTLTVPHVEGWDVWSRALDIEATGDPEDRKAAEAVRKMLEGGSSSVIVRIAAAFLAWPRFWRKLRAAMKARQQGDEREIACDRFFEWTPGGDGEGHPHFHVWLWSPWICDNRIRELWTDALHAIGVPMRIRERACTACAGAKGCPTCHARRRDPCVDAEGRPLYERHELTHTSDKRKMRALHDARPRVVHRVGARAWVQRMREPDARMVRELMKGRDSIKLARFQSKDDASVISYAGGWAIVDVIDLVSARVFGDLQIALKGRRLAQGSLGLYADEEPPACPCCGAMGTRQAATWTGDDTKKTDAWNLHATKPERGPPHERADHDIAS